MSSNRGRPRTPVGPRFWTKVDIGSKTECWEWQSALDNHDYGAFHLNGTTQRAHRVAFLMSDDDIRTLEDIPGDVLRHDCDNPLCVNPVHLTPGTQSDNLKDHVRRTRDDRLTDDEIREIRERAADGEKHTELAEEFGRHPSNIDRIVRRDSFDWVE